MKILIVGAAEPFSLETFYAEALSLYQNDVSIVPVHSLFTSYYKKSTFNKIKHRLHVSHIYAKLNRLILEKVKDERPDVVWVFKGMEVYPNTLRAIRECGVFLVNFNPDHPYHFTGYGSGNRNIVTGLREYDLHFCYAKSVMERIAHETKIVVKRLPFGYAVSDGDFQKIESVNENLRACFIGFCDAARLAVVRELSSTCIPIDVYGTGWSGKLQESEMLRINGPVYNEEYWRKLRSYRVQINMLRPHNAGNHNMRTFEVPAVGGILLTARSYEQSEFFEVGREIFDFGSFSELASNASELLSLSAESSSAIRLRARKRSVDSEYSYVERAKFVHDVLTDALAER